jgi:hypothetical protein
MILPARKYTVVLAVVAGSVAIPAAVVRLVSWAWGTSWAVADTWGMIQWASIFALTLTLPVSCVWMIIALVKKEGKALTVLMAAILIPVLAWIAGALTNFRILNSG